MTSFRHALRSLGKSPGFTATALGTLALCLGANLAIFAVVDTVLVRALPFPESDRLVVVFNAYPAAGAERSSTSIPNYFDRRAAIPAFASVSLFQPGSVVVGGTDTPQRTVNARVTPEFFQTLGVPLALGQSFTDENFIYGTDQVAVLTDGFWRTQFEADPEVVGKTFINDGLTVTIVGVLPPGFRYLSSPAQFFRPLSHALDDRAVNRRHSNNAQMIARLAPGATLAEAQAQIDAFNAQQLTDDPMAELVRGAGYHTLVKSLHADHVREVKPVLVILQAGGLLLLVIGAVNLANLLLIRASGRTKELAVRQALGASRRHISRDALVETLTLALGGGLLGLLIGAFGIELLDRLGTDRLPLGAAVQLDNRVALVALAAAVVVGAVLALPIIWFNLRTKLAAGLQTETRGGTSNRAVQFVRHFLIVAQISFAFFLLSGAGLLTVSLQRLLDTPPGFNPDHILTGQLALPWKNYQTPESRLAFVERLLPALRALPGVTHVALNSGLPFGPGTNDNATWIEGQPPQPGETIRAHYQSMATSEYWSLMSIPLRRGRLLEDADNQREQRVCVVDEAFAQRYWPGGDPIGHRISNDPDFADENAATIVGVVAATKQNSLREPDGHGAIYHPYRQFNANFFTLLVRTSLPPESLAPTVQKAILQLDPELPLDDIKPMQARIDDSLIAHRSPAILAGIFAGVALLLAAIGTYGVLAYAVNQRRREIGVRMALGALPGDVLRQFLRLGVVLFVIGLAIGLPLAWLGGHLMRSQLFGVGAFHAGVIVITSSVMALVVLVAILLPSQRAARVHPLEALRDE